MLFCHFKATLSGSAACCSTSITVQRAIRTASLALLLLGELLLLNHALVLQLPVLLHEALEPEELLVARRHALQLLLLKLLRNRRPASRWLSLRGEGEGGAERTFPRKPVRQCPKQLRGRASQRGGSGSARRSRGRAGRVRTP